MAKPKTKKVRLQKKKALTAQAKADRQATLDAVADAARRARADGKAPPPPKKLTEAERDERMRADHEAIQRASLRAGEASLEATKAKVSAASDHQTVTVRLGGDVPEGLMEVEIPNSPYHRLSLIDPKATPTAEQRSAIAQRHLEIAPKLGRYVPGAERLRILNAQQQPAAPAARVEAQDDEGGRQPSEANPGEEIMTTKKAKAKKATKATTAKKAKKPPMKEPHEFHSANDPSNSGHAKAKTAEAEKAKTAEAEKAKTAEAEKAKTATAKPKSELARQAAAANGAAATATRVRGVSGSKKDEFAGFALSSKLKVLSEKHDFRPGSIRETMFKKLLKCATVADVLKVTTDPWHLRTAVAAKRIQVLK